MPDYRAVAIAAAQRHGIDPNIFLAQINQESGFNPTARSSAGALGIAQFMPATAAGEHINPMDPNQALNAAAQMDAQNLAKYHNWQDVLSLYNSGRGWAQGQGIGETNNYVHSILAAAHSAGGAGSLVRNQGTGNLPVAPVGPQGPTGGFQAGGTMDPKAMMANLLLQAAGNGGQLDPASLLSMAMARKQQSMAAQTFGPTPSATSTPFTPGKSGYVHPFTGAKFGRLDQGIDWQGTPGQHVLAVGNAKVDAVKSDPNGFGTAVYYTLLDGPDKGKQIYVGHAAANVRPGQVVKAGSPVATVLQHPLGNATQPGWTEVGWASGGMPVSHNEGDTGSAQNFLSFINHL